MTLTLSQTLLTANVFFFGLAFFVHLASFYEKISLRGHSLALLCMRIGFLIGTFYFIAEAVRLGFFLPVVSASQAMAFFAWSLAFIYLTLIMSVQSESFGIILTPILTFFVAGALFMSGSDRIPDKALIEPVLLNPLFEIHIVGAFFAYANFALSFAAGILYLIQARELKLRHTGRFYHKLPSLEKLEKIIYQPLFWGVPLLGAAIFSGLVWSRLSFQATAIGNPKTLMTVITAILYTAILYFRYGRVVRGRKIIILNVIAFATVIFGFIGLQWIQNGAHYTMYLPK